MIIFFQTICLSSVAASYLARKIEESPHHLDILVFCPNDALPQVLDAGSLRWGSADVDHLVSEDLALLTGRHLGQQVLDHVKLSHQSGVLVVLALGQLLESLGENMYENDEDWRRSGHLVDDVVSPLLAPDASLHHLDELVRHLDGFDNAGHHHAEGCPGQSW